MERDTAAGAVSLGAAVEICGRQGACQGSADRRRFVECPNHSNDRQDGPARRSPAATLPAHIRGVLFDKDGTLLDFDRTWTAATQRVALDFAGGDAALALHLCVAVGWDAAAGRFAPGSTLAHGTNADVARAWCQAAGRAADDAAIARVDAAFARAVAGSLVPLADLDALTARLVARGLVLGLATNDGQASAEAQLRALGIRARFAFVAGWDFGGAPKPAADPVHAFAACAGLLPAQIAVVGDNRVDLMMARAAGAYAIAVAPDEAAEARLADLADATVASVAELSDFSRPRAGDHPA